MGDYEHIPVDPEVERQIAREEALRAIAEIQVKKAEMDAANKTADAEAAAADDFETQAAVLRQTPGYHGEIEDLHDPSTSAAQLALRPSALHPEDLAEFRKDVEAVKAGKTKRLTIGGPRAKLDWMSPTVDPRATGVSRLSPAAAPYVDPRAAGSAPAPPAAKASPPPVSGQGREVDDGGF